MKRFQSAPALMVVAALAASAGTVSAVEPMPYNEDGPVDFIPTLKVSQGYDDNVEEAPDGAEESSNVTKVVPTFLLRAQERANRYQLRYTPTFQRYSHDSDDNRVNHRAAAIGRVVLDSRNRFNVGLNARRNQATLSETNRRAGENEGDINARLSLDGTYTFGARGAKGQVVLDGSYVWNRYANNLTKASDIPGETGSNNQSEEYDSPRVGATFLWRVAPKTQLLVEGRYADFDYTWSESTLDSANMTGLVGAKWQATAKTSGSVRLGRQDKDFDDASKADTDATSWEAEVTWRPESFSTVRLSTGNTLEEGSESANGEDAVEQTTYAIRWDYDWDGQISSNVGYRFRDKDYLGGGADGRNDELNTVSVGVSYSFRRWLDFGLETRFKDNDSSLDGASYDRNTYFLTATLSL
jgi:hypothetical protein